jgi:hypothetical protein
MVCDGSDSAEDAYHFIGMKGARYILCYLIAIVVVAIFLDQAQNVRRCYFIGFEDSLYVDLSGPDIRVMNQDVFDRSEHTFDNFPGLIIVDRPNIDRGPLREGFTFYRTTSFMSELSDVRVFDLNDHTQQQIEDAYIAAVTYAKSDPYYAEYNPGDPPVTFYYPVEMIGAGLSLLGVVVVPALIARLIGYLAYENKLASASYRREHLMCVHCRYSIVGLDSPICPECGNFHTVPHQPLPESSDQSQT